MRQIVATELEIAVESVTSEMLDTGKVEPDTGVGASRATRIFGNATQMAAADARGKLLHAATGLFDSTVDGLILSGSGAVESKAGKRSAMPILSEQPVSPFAATVISKTSRSARAAALCVRAKVEVDPETGQVRVIDFTTAHSTGTVINPLMHQGQIDGGVVMGIGYALMEEVVIDGGKVVTSNFGDGKIPSICDIPPLKTVIQEFPVGNGPYGAMSIGEPPMIPIAAAIANAVQDAVGARIFDLPITAEKVLQALRAKR